MKWDTVSGSLLHSGQSSVRFLLARDVANIFKSVLSLVNRRRMSGFRTSVIYLGTTYSFDRICLVAKRVEDAMENKFPPNLNELVVQAIFKEFVRLATSHWWVVANISKPI